MLGFLRSGQALKVAPGRGIAHAIDKRRCISIDDPHTYSNHKTWEAIASSSVALLISASDVEQTTPAQAGNIRPEDHVLHGRGEQFLDIEALILDPPHSASAIPTGCYLVSQDEEPHLRRFLLSRGLVRLVKFSDVPFDTAGNPIVGGLFGVWHRNGKRLIFDRRHQNAIEERLGWVRLPLGCQFCKLVLKPGDGIWGSGADLKSCFFQCRNAPDAVPRNAVGNSFDGGEYPEWGGIPGHTYFSIEVIGI